MLHLQIALANFYGISYKTAARLCARLQLHERATVSSLTDAQVTELSAYLSSPGSIPARKPSPTSPLPLANLSEAGAVAEAQAGPSRQRDGELPASQRPSASSDPLRSIVLESDLRRQQQANIAHHRTVGSYVGRRHAGGFPVRGQRTRRNAQTARKLNRLERRQFGTYAQSS